MAREAVYEALRAVRFGGEALTTSGRLSPLHVTQEGAVSLAITVRPDEVADAETVRAKASELIAGLAGVRSVQVSLTAERAGASPLETTASRGLPPRPGPAPTRPRAQEIEGVRHVVAVASGKGGVGKSTTACNLALGLAARGLRVGFLDADIYGPSGPKLFGLEGERPRVISGRLLEPLSAYGIQVMSIGFMVAADDAIVWRGPMVVSALNQMLREVAWDALDVLVADMPPGTGDVQLSLAQTVPLTGAVIVSTPQDLALLDARRAVAMFGKVAVPVLGIVENMATFACPHCGGLSHPFGHGGAQREAERLGIPFLGEVPLEIAIRETSDSGRPVVASDPHGPHAAAFRSIADRVWQQIDGAVAARPVPRIVIE